MYRLQLNGLSWVKVKQTKHKSDKWNFIWVGKGTNR